MINVTTSQRQASNPTSSAWVSANAGSGKTRVLVDRVIRIMLAGVDPATILCITYTKAAAAEMAARVHERLGAWVGMSDAVLTQQLEDLGTPDITPATLSLARRLFTSALETPGGFKIQTIHAFCERLLQLFPIEAGMAPGFTVLDERQASEFLSSSRDAILSRARGRDSGVLSDAFHLLAQYVQPDGFNNLLEMMLTKKRDLQDLLIEKGSVDGVEQELKLHLDISADETLASLRDDLLNVDRDMAMAAIAALSSSLKTNQKTAAFYTQLLSTNQHDALELLCRQHAFTAEGERPKSLKSIVTQGFADSNPALGAWIAQDFERIAAIVGRIDDLTRIEVTLALLAFCFAIIVHFEETKRLHGTYDFDDLILRTRDLLHDRGASQWVRYKLDRGFEHVLVDEAQDTSLAQWEIINALTEEFFSGAGTHTDADRTLFVVGDRKQSIYSFQGADPAAFDTSRARFKEQILAVRQPFNNVDLTVSYRTTSDILAIVDAVFADGNLARVGLDGGADGVLHHESNRRGERGLFELWPLVVPADKSEQLPWNAPVDRDPASSPQRVLARKIADKIKSWIGNREIAALGRVVRPGDILILFRTRNSLFTATIGELRKLGIPVAGADRLTLSKNIAVLDMLALVRFMLLPKDDYSLACVLKSPLVPLPFSEEQLFDLAHERAHDTLWSRLSNATEEWAKAAHARLERWCENARNARPFEFFSMVLLETRKSFYSRLGSEADDALNGLLEASLMYEEQHATSLSGFLNWFLADDAEIKRDMESGGNEVRLMTVHGAKGLESSIVILPDTTGLPNNRKSSSLMFLDRGEGKARLPLWKLPKLTHSDKLSGWRLEREEAGLEEYRRQLYVAMTRARDELYFCGYQGEREIAEQSWYEMVRKSLLEPANGTDLLRYVELSDGEGIWRHGEDPGWQSSGPGEDIVELEPPSWLTEMPRFPEALLGVSPQWVSTPAAFDVHSRRGVTQGRVIHRILQLIPGESQATATALARRLLDKNQMDSALGEKLVQLVFHPDYMVFYGPLSRAEVSIGGLLRGGERFSGRIDRLLVLEDEIWILDYKSDWRVPDTLTPTHPYIRQMAGYALALRQAYPGKRVKVALLWIMAQRLQWIPDELLAEGILNVAHSDDSTRASDA